MNTFEPEFQVCAVGWYFPPGYYDRLCLFESVHVVAHRPNYLLARFPGGLRENIGLEWGAYQHFLTRHWDGISSVLFTHDDIKVCCPDDHFVGYVKTLAAHPALTAGPSRSRFFMMKAEALRRIRNDGGFWYDRDNHGNVIHNKWKVNRGLRSARRQSSRLGIKFTPVSCDGILELGKRGIFDPANPTLT